MAKKIIIFSLIFFYLFNFIFADNVFLSWENIQNLTANSDSFSWSEIVSWQQISSQTWLTLTAVDTSWDVNSQATITWYENVSLSGESADNLITGGDTNQTNLNLSNIEIFNTWTDTWNISLPQIIISEVFFDGTDEWVEFTNIWSSDFSWNLILNWTKTTSISLNNISIPYGTSKILWDNGDILIDKNYIIRSWLALSISDTSNIDIHLLYSWTEIDSFFVESSLVNNLNDKKTSFEKLYSSGDLIISPTLSDRTFNAVSWNIANPWKFNDIISSSAPTYLSWTFTCIDSWLDQTFRISEVFIWNSDFSPYIEIEWLSHFDWNIVISWTILQDPITIQLEIDDNDRILITNSASDRGNNFQTIIDSWFSLGSTSWTLIAYGQSWQVLDSVDILSLSANKSAYLSAWDSCKRLFYTTKNFSPWLDDTKFFKYITEWASTTSIIYVPSGGWWSSCPVCNSCSANTWNQTTTWIQAPISNPQTDISSQIKLINIDYDPEGNDTDRESITLQSLSNLDINLTSYRLQVVWQTSKKTIRWDILWANQTQTFIWNYQFPNDAHCVNLLLWEDILDTFCYISKANIIGKLNPEDPSFTWENIFSWALFSLTWFQFHITSILPNAIWKDDKEEITLMALQTWNWSGGSIFLPINLEWFYLQISTHKKKLSWFLIPGQEELFTGDFWFPNKASCISLFYYDLFLDKFCYPKPWEWEKFINSNWNISSLSDLDFNILNSAKLEKFWNNLCLTYLGETFICKVIPSWKTAIQTKNENKLYENRISFLQNYLISDRETLYYNSDFIQLFNLLRENKKLVKQWQVLTNIAGEKISIFDFSQQLALKTEESWLRYLGDLILAWLFDKQFLEKYQKFKQQYLRNDEW